MRRHVPYLHSSLYLRCDTWLGLPTASHCCHISGTRQQAGQARSPHLLKGSTAAAGCLLLRQALLCGSTLLHACGGLHQSCQQDCSVSRVQRVGSQAKQSRPAALAGKCQAQARHAGTPACSLAWHMCCWTMQAHAASTTCLSSYTHAGALWHATCAAPYTAGAHKAGDLPARRRHDPLRARAAGTDLVGARRARCCRMD